MTKGRWVIAVAVGVTIGACERESMPTAEEVGTEPQPAAVDEAGRVLPHAQADEGEPIRIYHDLTRFDWYRQGEPLRVEERAYVVDGKPVTFEAAGLRRAGEYSGVEYYVRTTDERPYEVVFVPVFEQYWQPFMAEGGAPALAD